MSPAAEPPAAWRTLLEAEADYVKDLAVRWQTYSYVAAGTALVLAIIAASMRGYLAGGARIGNAVAYGLAGAIAATGAALCAVLQVVARRLLRDLATARVDAWEGEGRAEPKGRYVLFHAGPERFLIQLTSWDRAGLPLGGQRARIEHVPVTRVVLTLNGAPTYR